VPSCSRILRLRNHKFPLQDRHFGASRPECPYIRRERSGLEAKGTVTDGQRVIVTRGEVNWAQQDPGECVLGILSGIAIRSDGSVDPDSGTLHRYTWNPDNDDLDPLAYDYYPPDEAQIE